MKSQLLATLLLFFAVAFCYAEDLKSPTLKTDGGKLTPFEKLLLRLHHPHQAKQILNHHGENSNFQDQSVSKYDGSLEMINVEIPLILLQLVKLGKNIPLPSFHIESAYCICLFDCVCFSRIYDWRNPVITNEVDAQIKSSVVNGTSLRLEFTSPALQIESPEFTFDDIDYVAETRTFWRGITYFMRNYSMTFTGNFELGPNGLEVTGVEIDWNVESVGYLYHNGTRTYPYPDGSEEELGPEEHDFADDLTDNWADFKDDSAKQIEHWLNCFLTNGKSGGETCDKFLSDNLHHQTFAELLHGFGLSALNNARKQ